MSVTNYTPQTDGARCKYSYNKLKKVLYLVSKEHTKDIEIDNGEAYIQDLTELPLRINGFNIQFNEESSLDERYKFTKTVTLSMHGYVNHNAFSGRYYVILESQDGTYWMVNPDFPARVTYTFNLSNNNYQTDFTFSLQSNFPTLRLLNNFEAVSPVCLGFNVTGVQNLKLLEKDLAALDVEGRRVYAYGKPFQDIEFLGNQCSLQETFDGEKVTNTIEFDIALDAYKSSWHYSLLEFVQNLYAAIVTPKGNDNEFYVGFNFGLEPNFTVTSSSEQAGSDVITVRLVEMSSHGSTAAKDWSEEQSTDTRWIFVKWVGTVKCYECVSQGTAQYLVEQEVIGNGVSTGRYRCLQGYRSYYEGLGLNIVGEFTMTSTFTDNTCSGDNCQLNTTLPDTITYTTTGCSSYTVSASCDWNAEDLPSYITVSPSSGVADSSYTISVCNTQEVTENVSGTFKIRSGGNIKVVNVILSTGGFLQPTAHSINCLAQNVTFTYDPACPISVTSIDPQLTYQISNTQLTVNVPRNYGSVMRNWSITVTDCKGRTQTVHIYQDKTYENWINVDGYLCVGTDSYSRQRRYTGTTSSNLVATEEYRPGTVIQTGDTRCTSSQTKWEWDNTSYYCVNGVKFKAVFEWISYDNGTTWTKTGATRLGDSVDDSTEHFCDQEATYDWRLSTKWECTTGIKLLAYYSDGKVNSINCDGNGLTSGDTKPSGYTASAMTSAEIGNCVTSIGDAAFGSYSEDECCSTLSSITIPDSVTEIGANAFANCSGLTSVTIPDSVTSIGTAAFWGCTSLISVTVNATIPPTLGIGWEFGNTNDCVIYVPAASVDTYKTTSRWSDYASRIQAIQ